jgi:isopentenyl-diphosphate Delta-isomerase
MSIQNRKKDHVDLTVHQDVFYRKKTGFDDYDFQHNALPEVNFDEVECSAGFLGRRFSLPLFISSMTGGYHDAESVNAIIARFCEEKNLPFGVGSQRAMLDDFTQTDSFSIARKQAPSAFIAANIGGPQLIGGLSKRKIRLLVETIQADAVIIHLNPLQELMQPEGDTNFHGIKDGIAYFIEYCDLPVIVKETGAGISAQTAEQLLKIGVKVIDVAGAGGTSWAKVENLRSRTKSPLHSFDDWGIPTAKCIIEVEKLRDMYAFELIASGGIRSSFDIVKSIALGADFSAIAQPVIKAIITGGRDELERMYQQWHREIKTILTLLGCKNISEVKKSHLRKKIHSGSAGQES